MNDLISRQAAIEHLKKRLYETALNNVTEHPYYEEMADNRVSVWLKEVPSAEPAQGEMIKEIRKWINSGNRGSADYFIVDKIEEIINKYE